MNLLFIDSTIPGINTFLKGVNENTKFILYSIDDTFELLNEKIENLNISEFSNIGFVFVDEHNPLKMFISYNTFISINNEEITGNNTTNFIKNIVQKYKVKTIDFLACNLLNYKEWKNYFNYLVKENDGIKVRASNDRTGNLNAGGDWVLESTNEDISNLYFNEKIGNWSYLLDSTSEHVGICDISGNLFMAGDNYRKQISNSSEAEYNSYYNTGITNILIVSCGLNYTIIIKKDGTVWGRGNHYFGQLGTGPSPHYIEVDYKQCVDYTNNPITGAIFVSCGDTHTIIVKNDGSVWACGRNNAGQLGDGTQADKNKFVQCIDYLNNYVTGAISVSGGEIYTAILKEDGTVWASGANMHGQLSDGTIGEKNKFVQCIDDSNNPVTEVISISCGDLHTAIIKNNGTVWACGKNSYGQLGNGEKGSSADKSKFVQCKDSTNNYITGAVSVSCGVEYTAIIKNNGTVWTCGKNDYGQLGNGQNGVSTEQSKFVQCKDSTLISPNDYITGAISLLCVGRSTIILKDDKTVWACGSNLTGVLGTPLGANYYYNDENKFAHSSTFVNSAKIPGPPIKNVQNDTNNVVSIDTTNNFTYFPDKISTKVKSTYITNTSTTFNTNIININKVIKLEPANTIFSNYVSFDVNVLTTNDIIVYFKSETDINPVQINEGSSSDINYGAYFIKKNSNTITIYTKHFTEVGIGYNINTVGCLLKGTKILTPSGYRLVESLKNGDYIITDDNRNIKIKNIHESNIIAEKNSKLLPFKIEKNSIEQNYPSEDTYLSRGHMIKYKNKWIQPSKYGKFEQINIDKIHYYHIELQNYEKDNLIINGGLVVESLSSGTEKDAKIWKKRSMNSLVINKPININNL